MHSGALSGPEDYQVIRERFFFVFFFCNFLFFLLHFKNKKINITISCLQPNDTDKKQKQKKTTTTLEYIITIS